MLLLNSSNSVLHLTNITEPGEYTCSITYRNGERQNNTVMVSHPSLAAAAAAAGVVVALAVVVFLVILAVVIVWK